MPHLTDLTIGTEFRGNDGESYKVTSNLNDESKLIIELERVVPIPTEEELLNIIEEEIIK
jgi:hypothetical protein